MAGDKKEERAVKKEKIREGDGERERETNHTLSNMDMLNTS